MAELLLGPLASVFEEQYLEEVLPLTLSLSLTLTLTLTLTRYEKSNSPIKKFLPIIASSPVYPVIYDKVRARVS